MWLYSGNKAGSCVVAIKRQESQKLCLHLCIHIICIDGGIKLIFTIYLFNSFFPIFIGNPIFKRNKHTFVLESGAQLL